MKKMDQLMFIEIYLFERGGSKGAGEGNPDSTFTTVKINEFKIISS